MCIRDSIHMQFLVDDLDRNIHKNARDKTDKEGADHIDIGTARRDGDKSGK